MSNMNYRVISNYKSHKFASYKEALSFKKENGGQIYKKTYTYEN